MNALKRIALLLVLVMAVAMVGTASAELSFEEGTLLRMGTGYNNAKTGLTFDPEVAGEGITLADGKTYNSGDLKPTWVAVQDKLGVKFESVYQGNSATKEFDYWKEKMGDVDMLSGTAAKLSEAGEAGLVVNIADYLDDMPNFKAYLEANPIVRLSITGNTDTGAIYFSPYFDGVNDIERMPLMRVDWVAKLLNGEGEFTAEACKNLAAPVYQPYMPTEGSISIDVVTPDGTAVETITKDYDKGGNIVAKIRCGCPARNRRRHRCQHAAHLHRRGVRRILRHRARQSVHRTERGLGRGRAGRAAALRRGEPADAERHRHDSGPLQP